MRTLKSRWATVLFAQAWLVGLSAGVGSCRANTAAVPIGLTGWNANVIYMTSYPGEVVQGFDGEGTGSYSWVQNGIYGNVTETTGLPASGTFFSNVTDQYTGAKTQFQFQPYNGNNELKLGNTALPGHTLTVTTPAGYNSLAILAASGNIGGDYTSTFTLTFADGTTSGPITYDPYDWGGGSSQQKVFSSNRSRSPSGTEGANLPTISSASYNMYETDLNLNNYTSSDGALDSAKYIQSITFSEPTGGRIGVFAISGVQNPSAQVPDPTTISLLAVGAVILLVRWPAGRRARPMG